MEPIIPLQQTNPSPVPKETSALPQRRHVSRMWLILIAVLVLGGAVGWYYYLYVYRGIDTEFSPSVSVSAPAEDTAREALSTQGTSSEVSAIEADLYTTDLNNLDQELGEIESLLQ